MRPTPRPGGFQPGAGEKVLYFLLLEAFAAKVGQVRQTGLLQHRVYLLKGMPYQVSHTERRRDPGYNIS
jgi:hypothetical protein